MVDAPTFKLIIVDDEGKSTVVPLTRNEYSIGRQEGNVIRLTERNVSRKHARLYKENGEFFIEDLKSYNGVFVNSERIKDKVSLKSGDNIQIGDYRLIFREVSTVEAEESVIIKETIKPPLPRVASALPGEKPKLIVINGPRPGWVINLDEGETIIGRNENVTIVIDEPSVSREHAKIILKEDYCKIMDLGSSNGVKINGIAIKEHYLSHGDTIELGNILIRFVAAGAWDLLLEQIQQQEALAAAASWKKPLAIAIPFLIVALAVIGGIIYLISAGQNNKAGVSSVELLPGGERNIENITNVDELVRGAQKYYEGFQWKEAINYAAKALQYEPTNEKASKIKERATRELENMPIFEQGLIAVRAKQWESAYRNFARLSLDSAYRNKPEFKMALDNFLGELHNEMESAYNSKNFAKAEEKALIIDSIPEATDYYKEEARKYMQLIKKEVKKDTTGSGTTSSETPGGKGKKKGGEETTYVEKGGEETAGEGDPVEEARKAILAGDQLKCIKILEKAKTSQMTLKLLATCYKAAGNLDRYYNILERYVSKYPTAPDAEKFRSILKQAGKL